MTNNKQLPVVTNNKQLPVFVYGTLRKGYGNYLRLLEGKTDTIMEANTTGEMYSVGGFPAVVPGADTIIGELVYIKPKLYDKVMADLDRLEGYVPEDINQSMYIRKVVDVVTASGKVVEAYIYIWNSGVTSLPKVHSGDWKQFHPPYSPSWYSGNRYGGEWHVVIVNTPNGERMAVTNDWDDDKYEILEDYLEAEVAILTAQSLSKDWHIELFNKEKDTIIPMRDV